jgi:hypothetical protein
MLVGEKIQKSRWHIVIFCGHTNVKCYIHVITSVTMIEKRKMMTRILLPSIGITSLLAAMLFGMANFQAIAQNGAANQTASLEPLRNSINETLQALENNDTAAALQSLNGADSQLFEIMRNLPSSEEVEEEGEEESD